MDESMSVDLGYLIPKLFGDPKYGTGDAPDDPSLASQYVRDLLRQQEGGVDLVDLEGKAFSLGRSKGSQSPIRDCRFSEEGYTDAVHQIRTDANGNVKWYVEAVNDGYGGGIGAGNPQPGSAFCTGYFYYLPSDGTNIRITGKHKCVGKGEGSLGYGRANMHVFAHNNGWFGGTRKDIYEAEIARDNVNEVKSFYARLDLDPAFPYVSISFEAAHSGPGGSNGGTANAPGMKSEIYDLEVEFLG
jgi:hypothetical protein